MINWIASPRKLLKILIYGALAAGVLLALSRKMLPSYYEQGVRAFEAGKPDRAIYLLTNSIEKDGHWESTYLYRGRSYILVNKYDEAVLDFSKGLKLLESEQPRVATDEEALKWNQYSQAEHYVWRGLIYYENRQYDLAREDLTTAISLKRENPRAYYIRANVNREEGRIGAALSDYHMAISHYPGKYELFRHPVDFISVCRKEMYEALKANTSWPSVLRSEL